MTASLSKFRVTDHPEALPNKCAGCGIGHGEPGRRFIDLSLDVDYYGVVYWCTTCFKEVANLLGYASYAQQVEIVDSFHKLYTACAELRMENEFLRSAVNGMSSHRCGVFSGATLNANVVPVSESGHGIQGISDIVDGNDNPAADNGQSPSVEGGEKPQSNPVEHFVVEGPSDDGGDAKRNAKPAKHRDIADEI